MKKLIMLSIMLCSNCKALDLVLDGYKYPVIGTFEYHYGVSLYITNIDMFNCISISTGNPPPIAFGMIFTTDTAIIGLVNNQVYDYGQGLFFIESILGDVVCDNATLYVPIDPNNGIFKDGFED